MRLKIEMRFGGILIISNLLGDTKKMLKLLCECDRCVSTGLHGTLHSMTAGKHEHARHILSCCQP